MRISFGFIAVIPVCGFGEKVYGIRWLMYLSIVPNFPGGFGLSDQHAESVADMSSSLESLLHEKGNIRIINQVEQIMGRCQLLIGDGRTGRRVGPGAERSCIYNQEMCR